MRFPSIDFKFEEIQLLPSYTGHDGKPHRYGDQLITGTADIQYDADGDWWVAAIWLETSERIEPFSHHKPEYRMREIARHEPFHTLVKAAIERECEDAIRDLVGQTYREAAE